MDGATDDPTGWTPLTPIQAPFWATWKHFPDRAMEGSVARVEWHVEIDPVLFAEAFGQLVQKVDTLRLVFAEIDGLPMQRARPAIDSPLAIRDFRNEVSPVAAGHAWLDALELAPFDLTRKCFTAGLARVGTTHWLFQICTHHSASDYVTSNLVIQRLDEIYRCLRSGQDVSGLEYPSFLEYIERAQRHWVPPKVVGPKTARLTPLLPPPSGPFRQPVQVMRMVAHLGKARAARLRRLADVELQTPDRGDATKILDVFLAVTLAFQTRLSGEAVSTLATMSHGRFDPESREVGGAFIRTVPLSVSLDPTWRWKDLHDMVRRSRAEAFRAVRAGAGIESPDFCTTINFLPDPRPQFLGATSRSVFGTAAPGVVGRDLNIRIEAPDEPGDFKLVFRLSKDLRAAFARTDLIEIWGRLLDGLAAGRSIEEIPLGGGELIQQAKHRARQAMTAPEPRHRTLVDAVTEHVELRPDAIAVRDGDRSITYAEVDVQSRRVAAALTDRGVRAGDIVAMRLPRSAPIVPAILGVLRSGAAFYSIDTQQPTERVRTTLADAGVRFLLHPRTQPPDGFEGIEPLAVEDLLDGPEPGVRSLPEIDPSRPMYVMFTSGTSGTPKGVLVPHESFMRYQEWAIGLISEDGPIDWALSTSLAFESAYRSFMSLGTGGTLHCYDAPDNVTGMSVLNAITDDLCDGICLTPSHLRLVVTRRWNVRRLRSIISIGEALPVDLARAVTIAFPGIRLLNFYGPTESTMATTVHRYDPERDLGRTVPIGNAPPDAAVHVVDSALRPVPPGIPGEIVVGGARLSLGYLDRPTLTAERFVPDPFLAGGRLYRTGDLGFIDAGGRLVHLGRTDDQVKINGLRVELGEVESAVSRHPDVTDCAVVAAPGEPTRLVAFYVAGSEIDPGELRAATATVLARALVPALFIQIDRIPHSTSGKTDRRVLLATVPEGAEPPPTAPREAPRDATEIALASIWSTVLERKGINRHDDFFALGGDSLGFVNMVLLIEQELGTSIPLDALGTDTTLAGVANYLPKPRRTGPEASGVPRRGRTIRGAPDSHRQSEPTPSLGGEVPMLTKGSSYRELRRRLMVAASGWPGDQVGRRVSVLVQNRDSPGPPVIWCFNGAAEPRTLVGSSDWKEPLVALRSMEAVVEHGEARAGFRNRLVSDYADELQRHLPRVPYLLGGNCQSGRIATDLALELHRRGGTITQLLLLDFEPDQPLPFEVALFFGERSAPYNPFLRESTPQLRWSEQFAGVTWDILPVAHGEYFRPQNIGVLAERLTARIHARSGESTVG